MALENRRSRRPAWLAVAACLAAVWAGCGSGRTPDPRPDVILITLDTTRADRIGCYGCDFAATPILDAFAGEATRFRDATAHIAMTLTSHTTMLTGLTQLEHGVHRNSSYLLHDEFQTLAELLKEAGYETAAFVSSYALAPQYGLTQGFDVYLCPEQEQDGRITTQQAAEWLAERGDSSSVFMWVHYWEPHDPYTPPEPFASATKGLPYDAEISYMDSLLGQLLDALRAEGRYDPAHIIMIGDHGEGLFDHDEEFHSLLIYDSTVHIPFFWKRPGQTRGTTVDPVVGCVDITPTVCDYLDLKPGAAFEGLSLRPTMEKNRPPEREGLYLGSLVPYLAFEWSPLHAWRAQEWKYIACPEPELYHITSDPGELDNRVLRDPEIAARMREQLSDYMAEHDRVDMFNSARTLSVQEQERMASLGYIINEPPRADPGMAAWDTGEGGGGGIRLGDGDSDDARAAQGEVGSRFAGLPDPKKYIHLENEFERMRDGRTAQQWDEVLDASQIILRDHPGSRQAILGKGLALLELGRRPEAYEWLRARQASLHTSVSAWLAFGEAALSVGEYDEACNAYERVPMGSLGDLGHARQKIAAFTGAGRTRQALLLVDQVESKFAAIGISSTFEALREAITRIERAGLQPDHDRTSSAKAHLGALIGLELWGEAARFLERHRVVLGPDQSARFERVLFRRGTSAPERRAARQERRGVERD